MMPVRALGNNSMLVWIESSSMSHPTVQIGFLYVCMSRAPAEITLLIRCFAFYACRVQTGRYYLRVVYIYTDNKSSSPLINVSSFFVTKPHISINRLASLPYQECSKPSRLSGGIQIPQTHHMPWTIHLSSYPKIQAVKTAIP